MNQIKERQEFENYRKIKLLGEGSFGKAFLVERVSDNLKCVLKQIDIGKMSEQEKKETVQEAKILEALSHPNIVKFIEVFKTKKGKLSIVMDFADGGDLQNRIKEQRGRPFGEAQVLEWFTQICLGLKHIHDRKILHRDLKGQNIFLTKQGIVKIGDFGIAKVLQNTMQNAKTVVGTPYYLSPEIVQSKAYSFKSDIWSLGVILYEMITLKPPFDAPSLHFLAMKIVRGAYTPITGNYSSEIKNLVASLINTNEKLRPDVNKILSLPIIQNRIKSFLTETVYHHEFSHTILHKQNVFDPKKQQLLQIQNLQQQIQQQSKSPIQQPQQRYQPAPNLNKPNNQVLSQQQFYQQQKLLNPAVNQQPLKNQVSPGMAGAFNYYPKSNNEQPKPSVVQQPVRQQVVNAKPNYHYQNQQPVVDQSQQIEKQMQIKRLEEQKAHEDRIREIDRKLKEKEDQLKKIDQSRRDKEVQDRKRRDYEIQLLENEKNRKVREEMDRKKQSQMQEEQTRRKLQDEQSKKIQESQMKRREEIEKLKKEGEKKIREDDYQRNQLEQQRKRDQQQKQLEDNKKRVEQQKQLQQQPTDLNWIKKLTEEASNKIFDIDKKIEAKQQQNKYLVEEQYKKVESPVKQAKSQSRIINPQDQVIKKINEQKQEVIQRKESENRSNVKKNPKEDRAKMMEELRKKKGNKGGNGFFIEIAGYEQQEYVEEKKQSKKPKSTQKKQSAKKQSAPSDRPPWQGLGIPEQDQEIQYEQQPPLKTQQQFYKEEDEPIQQQEQEQEYEQQQEQTMETEYRDVYQMYDEMLSLIKNDYTEQTNQIEEEKKSDSSEDEGFNDERDDEADLDGAGKKKVEKVDKSQKVDKKKRFDETLSTVQEEDEPELTFANTKQQKSGQGVQNIEDLKNDEEDRDDIDGEEDDNSTAESERKKDFTFAGADGLVMEEQISKYTNIEHLRDYLEIELGEEKIMKAFPILKEFGDAIFYDENGDDLAQKLDGILTRSELKKYQTFFASLIFMELEAEKDGGNGLMTAMKTLKNINATATFGKFL